MILWWYVLSSYNFAAFILNWLILMIVFFKITICYRWFLKYFFSWVFRLMFPLFYKSFDKSCVKKTLNFLKSHFIQIECCQEIGFRVFFCPTHCFGGAGNFFSNICNYKTRWCSQFSFYFQFHLGIHLVLLCCPEGSTSPVLPLLFHSPIF